MRTSHALGTVAAVALCATLAACGNDPPAGPSRPSAPSGPAGPAAVVDRVEINGPPSIAPGQSVSYSAVEYLSDGTTRPAPSAAWSSSNPSLVRITAAGVATAEPRSGETVISVKTTRTAAKEVLVLPDGTFRLVGSVTNADQQDVPIPEAMVQALGGVPAWTNAQGQYRLYGVPSDALILVSRVGYRSIQEQVQLTAHTTRNFRLAVAPAPVPPKNYAGTYTLVLIAQSPCPNTPFPLTTELRQRSYEAVIDQDGSGLTVRLTEPRFAPHPTFPTDRFTGSVTSTGAEFRIEWNYDYYDRAANITERLTRESILMIGGTATTTESSSGLSGTLNGGFIHLVSGGWAGDCQAAAFTLTKR